MCGGIVGALTVQLPGDRRRGWLIHLAYNVCRIASYGAAGALMGGLGRLGLLLDGVLPVQMALYVLANLMLLGMGLYLLGVTRPLAFAEHYGQKLWSRIQPISRSFLPVRGIAQALPLGILWGWLPCGLVYSVLATALMSGSAARGALTMLSFGIGTLPNLLLAGMLLKRLHDVVRARSVRLASGALVLGFGLVGLINASTLGGNLWNGIVCKV